MGLAKQSYPSLSLPRTTCSAGTVQLPLQKVQKSHGDPSAPLIRLPFCRFAYTIRKQRWSRPAATKHWLKAKCSGHYCRNRTLCSINICYRHYRPQDGSKQALICTKMARNHKDLGARMLLGAPGIATRNKGIATRNKGIATRSKDATRGSWHRY